MQLRLPPLALLALSIAATDAFAQTTAASPLTDYGNSQAGPFGLHLVDMEVAMGNLIDLVGQQTKSYLDSTRRR
jgi:hypothetical protein